MEAGSLIDVICPVLGRPHKVQPFLESLRKTSDAPVLFVCSPWDKDQWFACDASDASVVIAPWFPDRGDFAKKINLGYRLTDQPFLLIAGDDLDFQPGWERAALNCAERTGAGVIGTQDQGNPNVKKGRHSTHPLVRRAYIEQHGGTMDGTGDVLCELYDHSWVDNELCETAKHRRQWAFAADSVIVHQHPMWNKGVMDATYEKANREAKEDTRLFVQRRQLWYAGRTRSGRPGQGV